VAEPAWPSPNIAPVRYYLNPSHELGQSAKAEASLEVNTPLSVGALAGHWCTFGQPGDWAADQREEDGQSVCFDTPPLAEPMEILGFPEVTLDLAADKPNALVSVRLCDVAPDGSSLMVTRGLLNLTHRDSHEFPEPLEPGRRCTATVRLNSIAHSLPAGHRWRVSISSTYWTQAWPSPELATLRLRAGEACRLTLPARAPRPEDADLTDFGPPEGSPPLTVEVLRSGGGRRLNVERDLVTGRIRITDRSDGGLVRQVASGIELGLQGLDEMSLREGDPLSTTARSERSETLNRGDWRTRVETMSTMTGDAEHFHLTAVLNAFEGETRVFTKTWHSSIPRDHV
jgi:hypothetical protein